MNSTEHLDHVALTNNSLLFPTLFKQAWGVFKKKWCALFTLALMPVIFLVSSYVILISAVYVVMKLSGVDDVLYTVFNVFHFAPQYVSAVFSISGIIIVLGTIYFALRATVASVKILSSEEKVSLRHAWHGISFKTIGSLFAVAVLLGIILAGGYVLLFVPVLFLATFYSNAIFTNIVEGKKGIDALVLSRQYVKGYGAIVFVNLLVIFSVGILFGLLFKLALGLGGLMAVAVYFGKISLISAVLIALIVIVIGVLLLILWKSFAFVFTYLMFKKLQALKVHHSANLAEGRKAVKVWLLLAIIVLAIYVGVMAALKHSKVFTSVQSQQLESF